MFFRLTAVGMFFPSLVAVLASPASHVVLADAGPEAPVPRIRLAAGGRRSGVGEIWTNPLMEWIPCRGGPHYEATFVLDRPGLYEVTVEPLAPNEEPAVGVANREAAIRLSNGEEPVGFSNGGPA